MCPGWVQWKTTYDKDCDYDKNGKNSATEIAAFNVAHTSSGFARAFWNALGMFNAVVEEPGGADVLMFVAAGLKLPGEGEGWTKLRGNQGWRDAEGQIWKKDMLHRDHYDVMNRRGDKVMEVDFEGNQIWPDGPKNKNKAP